MRNFVYVLLLLIPVSMQAQSQPTTAQETCPIDIVRVWKANIGQYVERDAISAEYVNTSGKNIVAIKFGALFFNALDEPAASYTNYMDADGLRWDTKRAAQGKGQRSTIGQWNLFKETVRNIDFYPLKIKFEDGTFWKDDGTYRCNAGVPELKIAKHGGLAAQATTIAELDHKSKKQSNDDDDK